MSRLWERPVVAPVCLVRWSRIMALFVLCPGAIECLARCDGFVAFWRRATCSPYGGQPLRATLVVRRRARLVLPDPTPFRYGRRRCAKRSHETPSRS